jgi:Subtilase family
MDPALQEQLTTITDSDEELEVLMRLTRPGQVPAKVRVISRFHDIITCRILRGDIEAVYASPLKASLKAARFISTNHAQTITNTNAAATPNNSARLPTGKGVVIGIIDWGCDFAHPNFLNKDGSTRLLAIWDQSDDSGGGLQPYNYGKLYTKKAINAALQTATPYQSLGYHPAKGDPGGQGAHGTHVMDIAAGNGSIGKKSSAPDAELIFVHLAASDGRGRGTLGDSVQATVRW